MSKNHGMRTPLGRVRALGSAKSGTHHWWLQRVTSIALLPLVVWFAFGLASHAGDPYPVMAAWIGRPFNAVLLLAFLAGLGLAVSVARRRFHAALVWLVAAPVAIALAWAVTDQVMSLLPNLM